MPLLTDGVNAVTVQKVGNVLQLRDIVLPVATILDQKREHVVELAASVSRVKLRKLPEDGAPSRYFFGSVLDARDLLATDPNFRVKFTTAK